MNFPFSPLAKASLIPSAVNQLTSSFAEDFREGIDINLGVGYVNDKTIPTDEILKAYENIKSHPEHYKNALNYGSSEGSLNLRNSIRNYYLKHGIGQLNQSDFNGKKILIGANGATSLLDSISDVLKPGIVITADPFYYIYTETLESKGFKIIVIPEDEDGLNTEILKKTLKEINTNEISFFYIVTVNNPSTTVLSDLRRKEIVEISTELSIQNNHLIPVVFDKAYEDIIHDPTLLQPVSGLKYDTLGNIIEIGTLSKILAPALRIGYAILPDNALATVLTQRTSDIGFSSSLINQEISSWLLDNYIEIQKSNVHQGYQKKAKYIKCLIDKYLSPYIETYTGGEASFYFYLTLKNIRTDKDSDFFSFLSRTTGIKEIDGERYKNPRLIYIPGNICSKTEKAPYQLRISYGFEENETFESAFQLMAEACEYVYK